jgi:glycosyltransferase involved in cell wall biosynthesis
MVEEAGTSTTIVPSSPQTQIANQNFMPSPATNPPVISPVKDDGLPRPFWSVVIPTYNSRPDFLEATLRSVLSQAPGPDAMEILVVDDCSPQGAPHELVRRVGGGRVQLCSHPKNLGLAGTWNSCLNRSRGQWVHILHQDDLILPGFYETFRRAFAQNQQVGAAYCRHVVIDENGQWGLPSALERNQPGILENWLDRIAVEQVIQTPAIVVKRSVYEELGGFLPELCYALDWEMWRRIAARRPFWYEPGIAACYRVHGSSATSRLRQTAGDIEDVRRSIDIASAYLPGDSARALTRKAREFYALWALEYGRDFSSDGAFGPACAQLRGALRCSASPKVLAQAAHYSLRGCWRFFRKLSGLPKPPPARN